MIKKYVKITAVFCAFALCAAVILYPIAKNTPHSVPAGVREKSFYTFLICGFDKGSKNTDVMMLASLDTENGALNILQIPRDTFVNPRDHGVTRVNALYAAAHRRGERACTALCGVLSDALCVEIDRYVFMDTAAFSLIIDAIGGVEYEVPLDMDYEDPDQGLYIHLRKGKQTLDGKKAEQFIRYRAGYATGDVGRVEARGGFLAAVFEQVRQRLSLMSAIGIAAELLPAVTTNMTATEAALFAAKLYASEAVNVKTLAGSAVQNPETGAWIYYALNKRAALCDINRYMRPEGSEVAYADFDRNALFTDDRKGKNPYISKYYYSETE